jgi:hypothetical protein
VSAIVASLVKTGVTHRMNFQSMVEIFCVRLFMAKDPQRCSNRAVIAQSQLHLRLFSPLATARVRLGR